MIFKEYEFRPLILGGDITAYSLVRSFYEEYQVKSLVVNMSQGGAVAKSQLCDIIYYENLEDESVFLKALNETAAKFKDKKLIVLGCGDWYVRMLIENKDKLAENFVIPYIDEELMNKIVLKDLFYETCAELDIPHPKTFVYDCKEKTELTYDFDYPIIAKTANSAMYHYAEFPGKKKVFKFNSKQELEEMLANLATSSYDYKFLIQEFIPGPDTNMRVLTCYSDQNAKVRFAAFGHVLLEEHTPSALGNPCCIINEVNDEVVAQATKFLEHIGYTGFSNFDIKYDPRDGKYKFFEINIRLGRSNYYVTGSGFNTVKLIVDDLIYGKEIPYHIADKEHLFTFVPKSVIKKYVADEKMKAKALDLMKKGKWSNPLFYSKDKSLYHFVFSRLAFLNQKKKFDTYM
ncbi:MAG TPA: ATP-grasp domain-containing protein [Clostridiales bacterium]|nr:ATP-grasp domain-containing protein [Clostridiales bacterium]